MKGLTWREHDQSPKPSAARITLWRRFDSRTGRAEQSTSAARLAANRCPRLFDKKRNQGERSEAIQPPPTEQSCRCQADYQNDRQITTCDRFDRVGSQRTEFNRAATFSL